MIELRPGHRVPEDWLQPPDLRSATALQRQMADAVDTTDRLAAVTCLGGVDVSNNPRDPAQRLFAAAVTLDTGLAVTGTAGVSETAPFPYVPGLLGFREAPAVVRALARLPRWPDLILVDGHGRSHPRRLGIASHLGVLLDLPTIGVAKSILVGAPDGPLGPEPGDRVPLSYRGTVIALALRTRRRANPLYISIGHRVTLDTAVAWVLRCATGYRLPEPTRQAHLAANLLRRGPAAAP